eukprot:GFUD01095331.1.p1 GENE.GFUD01095331.1~~GFUD01095331.1.p1  ORF type:complete len:728 (-),score=195.66 GFUD01095331.1:334-2223(-)
MENIGKAAADAYLDMFPQDLLDSNKRVRPIDVRIIEHDGFIDYEIEFVELSDEYDSDSVIDTGHDNQEGSDKLQTDSTNVKETTQKIATTVPVSTRVTAVTFVDLLRRARRKHRQNVLREEQKNRATTLQQTTESNFDFEAEVDLDQSGSTTSSTLTSARTFTEQTKSNFQSRNRLRNKDLGITRTVFKQRNISQHLVHQQLGDAASFKTLKLAERFLKTGRSTTFKPAKLTESSTKSNLNTEMENGQKDKADNVVENVANAQNVAAAQVYKTLSSTSSDNLLQVVDSSIKIPSESISVKASTSKSIQDIHQTTDYPGTDIGPTPTLSLIEELKRQLITISYDLSEDQSAHEDKPPTTTLAPGSDHSMLDTMYQLEDLQISESRSVADLYSEEETLTEKSEADEEIVQTERQEIQTEGSTNWKSYDITELPDAIQPFTQSVSNTDYETMQTKTAQITTETQYSLPERSPKRINSKGALSQIIEDSTDVEGLKASQTVLPNEVIKDSYQEANPGQYHEMNPGQYHEVNPGQYHESSPGQYHETHPGQYHEKHPGQDLGVENVTVDFDHTNESRTYNVKASAGDFIIGEVGRIDINSGQTLEGVRYTAVEGEVDQARIADILERYFGARAS